MTSPKVLDKDWLRQSFMLAKKTLEEEDILRRKTSAGFHKFSDTTLGGCAALNPHPQFSCYTDIKEERLVPLDQHQPDRAGMGRWYSENIEDNAIYLHVRCGNPVHNSFTGFLSGFYNSQASSLARTGRTNTFFYALGRVAGFVVSWYLAPIIWVGTAIDLLMGHPKTKYFYLRPAMPMFWSAVQNIVNTITVNKGMTIAQMPGEDPERPASEAEVRDFNNLLPDIFTKNGQFDIYSVSTRYQRMANEMYANLSRIRKNVGSEEERVKQETEWMAQGGILEADRTVSLDNYISRYLSTSLSKPLEVPVVPETAAKSVVTDGGPDGAPLQQSEETEVGMAAGMVESLSGYFTSEGRSELLAAYMAELNDGGQFVTFQVENPGTVSESFSNTAKDSALASAINSTSQSARDVRFNFADGNLVGGMAGAAIGAVTDAAKSLVTGALDSLMLGGLGAAFGNAVVDIPKYYESSSASLPQMNYSIKLRATYADDLSVLQDLWVPLAALLTMSLPLSTGAQSYTQPFYCEIYCKGTAQSKLCMVNSLSITRGTGAVGWTQDRNPLGIDVEISFIDLSSVMHVPITAAFSPFQKVFTPGGLASLFAGDEGAFADYLATISSLGLADQIYPIRRMKREYYKNQAQMQSWLSPYHTASWAGGWGISRLASGVFAATDRGRT